MRVYIHRQTGTLMQCMIGIAAALTAIRLASVPAGQGRTLTGVALGLLLVCLFLFRSLSVEVTRDRLTVWFGPGLIRRTFPADDILDSGIVRNPWHYGWGIRLTPSGWMFNVSGLDAVEIVLRNGRRFRIGTDEPLPLSTAIREVQRGTG